MSERFEQQKSEDGQNSTPSSFERRVEQLRQLQLQVSQKWDSDLTRRFNEGARQLTQDIENILISAVSLSLEDKLRLVSEVVTLVEWGYRQAPFGAKDEEKAREEKDRQASKSRHQALANLLNSISNQDFDEQVINNLLTLKDSSGRELSEVRQRLIEVMKDLPPVQGEIFLPKLKPNERVQVLANWPPENARPYVDQLLDQVNQKESSVGQIDKFRDIARIIEKWSQQEQEQIVRKVLIENNLDKYRTEPYFKIMREWPFDQSKLLLEELLARPLRSVTYTDQDYGFLAIAMSNWPQDEINSFLNEENNTRWAREIAQAESQKEAQKKYVFQKSYKAHYEGLLLGFKLQIISHRNESLTPEMIDCLKKGLDWEHQGKQWTVVNTLKNHPELFSQIAPDLFLSAGYDAAKYGVEILQTMSQDEQYKYIEAISNGFSRYWDRDSGAEEKLRTIVSAFDENHRIQVITNLLKREKSVWKGNNIRHDWENAFALLAKEQSIHDPSIIKAALKHSIAKLDFSLALKTDELVKKIERNEETEKLIIDAAGDAIAIKFNSLNNYSADDALGIATKYNLGELLSYVEKLPVYIQSLIKVFGVTDINGLTKLVNSNFEYASYLAKTPDESCQFNTEDIQSLQGIGLSLLEAEEVKRAGLNLAEIKNEDDYKRLFETLIKVDKSWEDEQNIGSPFKVGAESFGYKIMLDYLNRPDLTRHDALHAFGQIMKLYRASGLKPNQFYGNILNQVKLDDKDYESGTAHHHFNELALTLNINFAETLELAKRYQEIVSLQELVATLESPKNIFESWNNLKRYADLAKILEQREILEELKQLKDTGQEALYKYVEKLAFHPSSKVNMQAVIEFWREPGRFLGASDTHTPKEVHSRKKPSNYIEIPNLDLSAEELRDALVEGDMDGLQVFKPMEISYKIQIKGKKQTFIAKINRKSDPDGVLAGNDTACCMPFGEGKSTVYTFNPNTALFTLQVERPDGTKRTIAQSVLTKDRNIGIAIPEIIEKLNRVREHLTEVLSEDILKKSPAYLACDNVEVARNYQQDEYAKVIELLYRDFFKEYMSRFGEVQRFTTDKVIIGQGYSDTLTHLSEAPNTYAPLAPVGYSDKTGPQVFVLDLKQSDPTLQKSVTIPEVLPHQETKLDSRGISYLTFEDTLPVAYLEGKIYADNQSLLVYLHNIENGLIAKDISNAAKGRANMSLKYTDAKGDMKGYIVAYEGRLKNNRDYDYDDEYQDTEEVGEPIIYISDLAADKESRTAGGRLIQGFVELYRQNYLAQNNLIPVYAQARETTSYPIIQRQLERMGQDLGIKFELEELPTYKEGQDTMHPVIIRPLR